jgi:carbonic anhydrase/acetyltransferase-like protein (isoleucine patch superfamily)
VNHAFPFSRFEMHLHRFYRRLVFRRRLKSLGEHSFISPFAILECMNCISVGSRSSIGRGTLVQATEKYLEDVFTPSIEIGDDVYIGQRCTISTATEIVIGHGTTIGDQVYIGGGRHGYEDPKKGVLPQRLVAGSVRIGPRSWIGYGAFVSGAGELEIGEHAIVGANSVVIRSVPAFTLVAGSPAKPIKRFDPTRSLWVGV